MGTGVLGSPSDSACSVHQRRVGHLKLGEGRAQFEKTEHRRASVEVALVWAKVWWGQGEDAFRLLRGSGMHQSVTAPLLLAHVT